jgi:hypothetical protein
MQGVGLPQSGLVQVPFIGTTRGTSPFPPTRLDLWCCRDQLALAASRNRPSFAVARNCGMGSSSLDADVSVFDRLHMVLDLNS